MVGVEQGTEHKIAISLGMNQLLPLTGELHFEYRG
jgi:hypothetical protein